jgi:hypothetical protein
MTDHIPLYPDEATIAVLVLGKRAKDWPRIAKYMEDKHGLPRVDELMGGRYWPAVEECFRLRQGYSALPRVDGSPPPDMRRGIRIVPFKPDGKDNLSGSPRPRSKPRKRNAKPAD